MTYLDLKLFLAIFRQLKTSLRNLLNGMQVTFYNWGHLGGNRANLGDRIMWEVLVSKVISNILRESDSIVSLFSTDISYTIERLRYILRRPEIYQRVYVNPFPLMNPYDFIRLARITKRSDALVIGGGELIYDATTYIYSLYTLYPALFNKNTVFIGVGFAEENLIPTTRAIVSRIDKNVRLIIVRDKESFNNFKKYFKNSQVIQGVDIAYSYLDSVLDSFKQHYSDMDEMQLCIFPRIVFPKSCISIINYLPFEYKRYAVLHEFEKRSLFYAYMMQMVVRKLLDGGATIKAITLIPSNFNNKADLMLCKRTVHLLEKSFGTRLEIRMLHKYKLEDVVSLLAKCKYVIASTYHGALLASLVSLHFPLKMLVLSYAKKVNELCRELGITYIDMREITAVKHLRNVLEKLEFSKPDQVKIRSNVSLSNQILELLVKEIFAGVTNWKA
jgi:polysaccharide pyruvyl transferase WcaK-like protein